MATTVLKNRLPNLSSPRLPQFLSSLSSNHQARLLTAPSASGKSDTDVDRKEDIVIVGGGIAGLATALSLHRLGLKSLVLEHADMLRTSGVSLSLSRNAWGALDILGIGDEIRSKFFRVKGCVMKTEQGKEIFTFDFNHDDNSQEVRAVERKTLLQALANHLPPDAIRYASQLEKIEATETGATLLKLKDGPRISAQVVVGSDGIRSQVAKWMGFGETTYAGHRCFRGLGPYPKGTSSSLEPRVNYMYGRGLRAVYIPASPTKIYWSIIYNEPNPGPGTTNPSELKDQVQKLMNGWPADIVEIVDQTPEDAMICNALEDRWPWPIITPPPVKGRVVLAGDAWHPMTPNLGQGACCALEDAVTLSSKVHQALGSGTIRIEDALKSYQKERWPRVFPLAVQSNLVGAFLQSENPVVCRIRNEILPKLIKAGLKAVWKFDPLKEQKHTPRNS